MTGASGDREVHFRPYAERDRMDVSKLLTTDDPNEVTCYTCNLVKQAIIDEIEKEK